MRNFPLFLKKKSASKNRYTVLMRMFVVNEKTLNTSLESSRILNVGLCFAP